MDEYGNDWKMISKQFPSINLCYLRSYKKAIKVTLYELFKAINK